MGSWRFRCSATFVTLVLALGMAGPGASATPGPGGHGGLLAANAVAAQVAAPAEEEKLLNEGAEAVPNLFVPADRSQLRLLAKARQLADRGRYAEAVRCVGAIL